MLTVGVLDANQKIHPDYKGLTMSVVGQWIQWEMDRRDMDASQVTECDVLFLVFAGSVDWYSECRRVLRSAGINEDPEARAGAPFIIAGGPVDAIPFTAFRIADALTVGEGYGAVRDVLDAIKAGATAGDIRDYFKRATNALERLQVIGIPRDPNRPWLLKDRPPILATPSNYIDWLVPAVKSGDKVIRIIGSKGCHFKCSYCATTYRQDYQLNPRGGAVLRLAQRLTDAGERVQILSNDPANIPWYKDLKIRNDSGSYTIEEFKDPENRRAIIRQRPRIVRFGIEGISPRIRKAWGKPIPNEVLLGVLADLQRSKIGSHMFFIQGAPYEGEPDWMEFRELWQRFCEVVTRGICRIKFTTFMPCPPSPLARFVAGPEYPDHWEEFMRWVVRNAASRHLFTISGRGLDSRATDNADQMQVPVEIARALTRDPGTFDLAPAPEDFARLPSEIIRWPIKPETRWRIAEKYKRKMNPSSG